MADRLALFGDRREAGRRLAEALKTLRGHELLVVALPRGGVPVAFEVAKALVAPLDILLVRKLGAPFHPEYGIGAIAEGGIRFIRREEVEMIGVSDEELERVVAAETAELERRQRLYRGAEEPLPVKGRTVILVDDGIATGGTAIAAGQALKARGAAKVVLAVPVAPPGSEQRLADDFDGVFCLAEPHGFSGSVSSTSTSARSATRRSPASWSRRACRARPRRSRISRCPRTRRRSNAQSRSNPRRERAWPATCGCRTTPPAW